MLKMGLHNVVDVAGIFPPTLLSENIPHLSIWMAVEIILDARVNAAFLNISLFYGTKEKNHSFFLK